MVRLSISQKELAKITEEEYDVMEQRFDKFFSDEVWAAKRIFRKSARDSGFTASRLKRKLETSPEKRHCNHGTKETD